MRKRLAIEHHLIRPNEVIELLEMMGGKNEDNADGCSFLYYTLCTPKINNPNNEKVICGFTNLKMQNDYFAIFTLEKFWKKYPYKLDELVLCDDGLLGVITKMEWDCEKCDMKYHVSFNPPVSYDIPVVDNKWYSSKNIKCKFMAAKNKKLAIKGHATRGKEVIELLEMMGGKNNYKVDGANINCTYIIRHFDHSIIGGWSSSTEIVFTLEEFLEKYPFKVNDRVIDKADGCPGVVCEMKWDEDVSDMKYCVAFGNGIDFGWFANDSIEFYKENENLEETQSNQDIDKDVFRKEFCERCGSQRCSGQDDELEDCERFKNLMDNLRKPSDKNHKMGSKSKLPSKYYEDRLKEIKSKREYDELRTPLDDDENKFPPFEPMFNMNDELEYKIPEGYEISEVSKDTVFIKPIKSKYPKTYEECRKHLSCDDKIKLEFVNQFLKLINSRNAYWKIAGEEMGLGKPWEPDWDKLSTNHEFIVIEKGCFTYSSMLLVFPTEEMRDAFAENFKDLIEQCKELL